MSVPATRNGNALAVDNGSAMQVMADVITAGDLARLTPAQRVEYYGATCRSLGINPLTKPFDFINLNGKLTLYATKGATDQLRALRGISVRVVSQETEGDVPVVTVEGTDHAGRTDTEIGAVSVTNLRGDNLANARMKALTKAKRRLTLSMVGLGMLDESEIGSVANARPVNVDPETGEIIDAEPPSEPQRQQARATVRPVPRQEPEPDPDPQPDDRDEPVSDGAGITKRQLRHIGALTNGLPGLDKARQLVELRRILAEVMPVGEGQERSRKDLTEEAAGEVIFRLQVLHDELADAAAAGGALPTQQPIDAEFAAVAGPDPNRWAN